MLRYEIDSATGCWNWSGYIGTHGYGAMSRGRLAHRVSWETHKGAIPPGLHVLHECDNRKCVNPAHLFLGGQSANMKDASAKGRLSPVSRGNLRGRRKGYASEKRKLDDAAAARIRQMVSDGHSIADAAYWAGCSHSLASSIVHGRTYRNAR